MPSQIPHVVIVGAGFAGLNVARGLAHAPVQISVIDKSNHHLFQPLLYQVATATLSPSQIASPIRHILRKQENTEVLLGEVTGIDSQRQVVKVGELEIPYDTLVLATGARHSYFGKEEWEKFAPGLKTLEDATSLRQKILLAFEKAEIETDETKKREWLHFVLVGGGPTGVEMAGAIAELAHRALASDFRHINPKQTQITLIEAGPRILSTFPDTLSARAQGGLEKLGVKVLTNSRVENITADGVWVKGELIRTSTIIWTAGVMASPVGRWLNVPTDRSGRIPVESDCSLTHFPNVFVLGDAAAHPGADGKPLPGVAPVAMQQGTFVAQVIQRRLKGATSKEVFHYRDKGNLATVGRKFAVADFGNLRLSGVIAWVTWVVVHIFYLVGFRNRLLVLLEWVWSYLSFQRGARLILPKNH